MSVHNLTRALALALAAVALASPGAYGQQVNGSQAQSTGPLTLEEAVEAALAYHPSVALAEARQEESAGILRQARAAWFPQLSSDASLTRYEEPWLVAPLHGFDPTMAPEFDRSLVRANLTAGYSLFDGGARGGRIDLAESGATLAEADRAVSEIQLTTEVSAAYLEIQSTVELLAAALSQREALEVERGRVEQFLEEGKAARVDLLRVQSALSRSEAVEISLRARLDVARGHFGRLTGISWETLPPDGLAPTRLREAPLSPLSEVVGLARSANPDLEVARQRLAGASAGVRIAKANWFPKVQAAGAYSDYGALDSDHTQEWQAGIMVSLPLFTGGVRKGERERASAQEREASEALRLTELRVEDGVEEALATVAESRALRAALEEGVEQAAEVARIEALALEVGAGVQTDFLRAQAELFQSRAALAQARHGEVMAGIRLARVTGELSVNWLRENTEVVR